MATNIGMQMSDFLDQLHKGITTDSPEATEAVGVKLAACLPVDSTLALHGDLGVGKTTFIRGLARKWEINEPITSPTFNLYNLYKGQRNLLHLDAYRLQSDADLDSLMLDDFLKSPWCFAIEWPIRIPNALPDDTWHLEMSITSNAQHQIKLLD